jgi:membrane-bound serine protease (ClpP class)
MASRLRLQVLAFRCVAVLVAGTGLLVLANPRGAVAADGRVVVLPTTGIVDQVMAGYIRDGIRHAANEGASAVVIRLDTPGGSLDSTRQIVSSILEAPLPVITWVAPQGSRAASAGTFITLAGHVALMAPGTNIGAASPVGSQGEDIGGTLGEKVMNDAVASITAIAEARGRNVAWAVSTVKEAKSYTATEAVAAGAVDGIAASLDQVLAAADGREFDIGGTMVKLALKGATTEEVPMNPLQGLLHLLADPNIAFILFTVGFYGLLFELQSPNFVTGILGAMAILLALVGFGSLPLNVGGLFLIVLAIVLFVLELTVTSHGLLTIGGLVCFVLGAAALYTEPGPTSPDVSVAWPIIAVMTGATTAFLGTVLIAAVRSRTVAYVAIGAGGGSGGGVPTGTVGLVRRPLSPVGSVHLAGEEWTARSIDGRGLERGLPVRVLGHEGLVLIVEPATAAGTGTAQEVSTP